MTHEMSYFLAFSAGVLSLLSPCVLPLIPSYFSYLTGISPKDPPPTQARNIIFKHAVLFTLGFSTIFILFGASATFLGKYVLSQQRMLQKIGGGLIVLFGLHAMGMLKLPFLMREKRFHFQERPVGWMGSFFIGIAFGAGWTPCVGPILGTVLVYASLSESVFLGMRLLAVYSLGLALPFLLMALGMTRFVEWVTGRPLLWMQRFSGIFLVIAGVMIFSNSLTYLTARLAAFGLGWSVGQ